ncbi:MAG TPA: ABC transporter ATP-binding protein [Archaeoglobus profundus]|nr:ABC transporter ATP-binding protein [Archaeoglobus profundus]
MIILETKNLSKFFDGLKALDNVNLAIQRNTITLIIGPNGSGKSTLINVVSGFYKATSGKVIFEGLDITNKPPHEIYKLGIARTFQIPKPLKKLTVLENLLIAEKHIGESILNCLSGKWLKKEEELVEKAFKILEFLKIDHLWDKEAYKLSGGQLKLLEIGRVLMVNPKLVIMDEPLAGVAPSLAHTILNKLTELKSKITFLIVEHRLDIILEYVDYVYVMANGKIIAEGRGKDVINDPKVVEVYLGDSYRES